MAILDMRKRGASEILRSPLLSGKQIIGRGNFCSVFDNGNTVLKLTGDRHQHALYTAKLDNPIFPKLVRDHGQVGMIGNAPAYLVEMERLEELGKCHQRQSFVKRFRQAYTGVYPAHDESHSEAECSAEAVAHMADNGSFNFRLKSGLLDLAEFMVGRPCVADFHARNFMVRGKQVVLNDPLCDYTYFNVW